MFHYFKIFTILLFTSIMLQAVDNSLTKEITNIAYLKYKMGNKNFHLTSNKVIDIIKYNNNLDIKLTKTAITSSNSTTVVYKDEKIYYKIVVELIGDKPINNLIFKDKIPKGTKYIKNSLKLNNKYINGYKDGIIEFNIKQISNNFLIHTIEFTVVVL